jgi:hypothetical protein
MIAVTLSPSLPDLAVKFAANRACFVEKRQHAQNGYFVVWQNVSQMMLAPEDLPPSAGNLAPSDQIANFYAHWKAAFECHVRDAASKLVSGIKRLRVIDAETDDARRLDVPSVTTQTWVTGGEAKKHVGAAVQVKCLPALEQGTRLTRHCHSSEAWNPSRSARGSQHPYAVMPGAEAIWVGSDDPTYGRAGDFQGSVSGGAEVQSRCRRITRSIKPQFTDGCCGAAVCTCAMHWPTQGEAKTRMSVDSSGESPVRTRIRAFLRTSS